MNAKLSVALSMRPAVAELAFPAPLLQRLAEVAEVIPGVITSFGAAAPLASAEVLLTGWGTLPIDAAVLDAAPKLRAIVHAAGSVKHLLDPAVWERGIIVSSAAAANAYPVAQYTVSVVLLAGKRAFKLAREYAGGRFKDATLIETGNYNRVVGIVGASKIGRLVLEMLAPHGFQLLVADPTLDDDAARRLGPAEVVPLEELLRRSDVVSLHAPALPETHHLIDAKRLALLRPGSILINTARGQLVDTEALTRHCALGRIDAVLDVTDPEPLPPGHPLMHLPNVLVTPHVAGAMGNEVQRLGEFAVDEIERLAAGLPLAGRVEAKQLAILA